MLIMGCFLNLCVHTATPEPNFGAYTDAIAREEGLVARWPFTEGAEVNADLRASGTPAWGAGGVSLPAGSWLVLDDTAALDTRRMTWEIVFRLDAAPGFAFNPCLVAMRNPQHATRLSVHIAGDYSGVVLWNGAHPSFTHLVDGPLEQGRWYHLAVADNGEDGVVLSLNGVRRDLDPPSGISHAARGLPLTVGAANPDGLEHLPCTVAHLAVYNRALSGEEVARHADTLGFAAYRAETGPVQRAQDDARRAEAEARRVERAKTIEAKKASMLADPALTARGESRVLRGEYLDAISLPVGGIGAGLIQMNGKAEPAIWQIFNNFAEVRVPDSFLAVRARVGNGDPVTRALQTVPAGPFAPMAALSFEGRYPFGWYRFEDDALPVKAELEVFNPFIPMNAKDSGIPCAVFNVTVSNPGETPAEVSLLASQQNAVGCTGRESAEGRAHVEYGGNVNRVVRKDAYTALHMTGHGSPSGETPCCADPSACDSAPGADGRGDMTLALLGAASARPSWTDADALAREFTETGLADADAASAPSPAGETVNGALAASFTLEPGASRTVTVVLTWFFPGEPEGAWRGKGTMYTNWYGSSLEVADDLAARLDSLTAQTRKYVDTFYESNLPVWLLDRISSQAAILRTRTCYWTQDGYFGGHEGTCPTIGCCPGNCNHVWHYAQAHARLFPEIGRRMREQALAHQFEDGGLQHRQMDSHPVCDGQMGDILGAYREHLLSADTEWLDARWPAIQKAMEYVINRWDADENGLFTGPQFNTLDSELGGATTWMGSLYCASLDACARMARLQGDSALADRYDKIRRDAAKNQNDLLWNGQYYIQVPDETPLHDYRTGCAIDQLLGEWWARQLGLDWIYPEDRAASALRALIEHNFQPDFHGVPQIPRKFVSDADAGMQMVAWPAGERRPLPHILYADEVMTGFEYSAAGAMVQRGLLREGLMVAKAIADRYDGRKRTDVTDAVHASWGYTGNPFGDDECGKFYARAMSVWSLLTACQGFQYDGPAGVLSFDPVWQPEDHASFFTVAEGWGLYTQRACTATLDLRHGRVSLKTFSVTGTPGLDADNVRVAVRNGGTPRWKAEAKDGRLTVSFPDGLTLTEGQVLGITVR